MSGAIFLDRDGVLCENRSTYVKSWDEFRWIPGAREAMRILARLDVPVVLVTNQSAINRGLTTVARVHNLHSRLQHAIRREHGRLDAVYVCPHRPEEGCACRKPGLLLFRRAAADLGLDFTRSYLIGDSGADLQAGWSLNMRVILVRTGLGQQTVAGLGGVGRDVHVTRDVLEAARWIETGYRKPLGHGSDLDESAIAASFVRGLP